MRANRVRVPIAVTATMLALAGCTASSGTTSAPNPQTAATSTPTATPTVCKDGKPGNASIQPARSSTATADWKSDKQVANILKAGKLRVGVSGDALLWGYSNPKNGNLNGYDVDVATDIAKALGVKPEFHVLPLSGRIAALNDTHNGVDIVAERFSMNCDRWQGTGSADAAINFSSAYYTAYQKLLVRKDLYDSNQHVDSLAKLKGYPVCGVNGSTSLAYLNDQQAKYGFRIVTAADSGQCLVEFQQGQAAAISADETTLAGFAAQDPFAVVISGNLPGAPQQAYGVGLPKDDEFTQYVNAVLQKLRADGTLTKIYHNTMGKAVAGPAPTPPTPVYGRDTSNLKQAS